MSNFAMLVYNATTGVESTLFWQDEEEFRMASEFLRKLTGRPASAKETNPDQPDFYYLETAEQAEALLNFGKQLSERKA